MSPYLRLLFAWTCAALALLLARGAHAQVDETSVIIVDVAPAASGLDPDELRTLIANELHVTTVRPDDARAESANGKLTIDVDHTTEELSVTYLGSGAPLTRRVPLPQSPLSARQAAVLLAGNLARDEGSQLAAVLRKQNKQAPTPARQEHAPTPTPEDTEEQEPRAAERGRTRWYGWQILIVDSASVVVAVAAKSEYAFLVGYGLGGPIVHWLHGRAETGFASLGLRVALPVGAGLLGYGLDYATGDPSCDQTWFCSRGLGGMLVGVFAGYVAAVAIDTAVLARERVDEPRRKSAMARPVLRIEPWATPSHAGAMGGLLGTF